MATLIKHRLTGAVLKVVDADSLSGADLSGADLSGADLSWADLSGADLSWADLSRANLSRANLSRANLSWSNLFGANLSGADLFGANLFGANLSGANLFVANLSGANLSGANLSGADLFGATIKDGLVLVGSRPFLRMGPLGSRNDTLILWLTDHGPYAQTGCFLGTLKEFDAAVLATHPDGSRHRRDYLAALEFFHLHAKLETESGA